MVDAKCVFIRKIIGGKYNTSLAIQVFDFFAKFVPRAYLLYYSVCCVWLIISYLISIMIDYLWINELIIN